MKKYNFTEIEKKWQAYWEDQNIFRGINPGEEGFDASKPKYYVLDMFPYPSGKGLHVGHPLGYIATDVVARYKRMKGFNVLHPMGFDAFGLPAEQYAVETGTHPAETTQKNIENMRRQLKACALSYDWDREISTTDPAYYKWTQWIFLKLFQSYFDEKEQKAKPIEGLIDTWQKEKRLFSDGFGNARLFDALSPQDKEKVLGEYRLAYIAEVPVNWCPELGTVLANEEVTNEGRSERGNFPVLKRPLKQWMLRITTYAERLVNDLKNVDWPAAVIDMQRNWVGKSEGAEICFKIEGCADALTVFTTRPDTICGCTFAVLAPEHPLLDKIVTKGQKDQLASYQKKAEAKSDVDRMADADSKTGIFTGAYAIHPVNGKKIPIWVSDYVLMGYGTGAVMAVPAHDQRDFDFAQTFNLDILSVIAPDEEWLQENAPENSDAGQLGELYAGHPQLFSQAFSGKGKVIHSNVDTLAINGQSPETASHAVISYLEGKGLGRRHVQYKLRDWLFSRQRYWGEPFPILHGEDGEIRAVDEAKLPVTLPEISDFKPIKPEDGVKEPLPSLSKAKSEWKTVELDGKRYHRELNTMPQWAGSCWYYLRYLDPHYSEAFVSNEAQEYWMGDTGVDLYVGGVEHAVLHLLYARFWHKVLFDLGVVSSTEPFGKLFNQGYIQAYAFQDERGLYVDAFSIDEVAPKEFQYQGKKVTRHLGKMGKSLKNSISPDEVIEQYGCDTFRLYEMYLGPIEQSKVWDTDAITGVHRFLQKVWRNLIDENSGALRISDAPASPELRSMLHQVIQTTSHYMENMRFNAAIAQLIQLNNALVQLDEVPGEIVAPFLIMLNPFAPHVCEEIWTLWKGVALSSSEVVWPTANTNFIQDDTVELVIQINGKKRSSLVFAKDTAKADVEKAVLEDQKLAKHIAGQQVIKFIYVPNRLVNIVVK